MAVEPLCYPGLAGGTLRAGQCLDSEQFRSASGTSRPLCDTLSARQASRTGCAIPWHGTHMKRREFVTLIGSAAVWPLAARAQQGERVRRIGVLMNLAADDVEGQQRLAAFLQGLQEAGWEVGRNVRID